MIIISVIQGQDKETENHQKCKKVIKRKKSHQNLELGIIIGSRLTNNYESPGKEKPKETLDIRNENIGTKSWMEKTPNACVMSAQQERFNRRGERRRMIPKK